MQSKINSPDFKCRLNSGFHFCSLFCVSHVQNA